MPKPGFLLVLILLAGGLFALVQKQELNHRRDLPQIDSVAVSGLGAERRLLVSGRHAEDCSAELHAVVMRFPQNLDIQLYRDVSSTAACGLQETPFVYELGLDSNVDASTIIINSQVWGDETDGDGSASYVELSLFPAHIDEATLLPADAAAEAYQLSLRGSQAVGCDLPEIFSVRETGEGIYVGVHNALDAEVVCPDMLIEIDETISLPATELPADTLLAVNTILISELETQNVNNSDKVLTNIFRVDARVTDRQPPQISLEIEGEHPDGCEYPVKVGQRREGNSINVEIYREVPADVFCPMILKPYQGTVQLEGSFAAGEYSINVNSHSQTIEV